MRMPKVIVMKLLEFKSYTFYAILFNIVQCCAISFNIAQYLKIEDIPLGFYTLKAKNRIKPPTLSLLYLTKIALLNLLGKVGRPFKGNLPTPKTPKNLTTTEVIRYG